MTLVSWARVHPYAAVGSVWCVIGNLVMEQLKKLDKVAYIRFASVYRSFEDIKEFGEEIARLED